MFGHLNLYFPNYIFFESRFKELCNLRKEFLCQMYAPLLESHQIHLVLDAGLVEGTCLKLVHKRTPRKEEAAGKMCGLKTFRE